MSWVVYDPYTAKIVEKFGLKNKAKTFLSLLPYQRRRDLLIAKVEPYKLEEWKTFIALCRRERGDR